MADKITAERSAAQAAFQTEKEKQAAEREKARKAAMVMAERAAAQSAVNARAKSDKMAAALATKKAATQKLWARCRQASAQVQEDEVSAAVVNRLRDIVEAARTPSMTFHDLP